MTSLFSAKPGVAGKIVSITGDTRFLNRVSSIGLTIGSRIEVVSNQHQA